MNKAPCIKCERRGCGAFHDKCEIYKEFRSQRLQEYDRKQKMGDMSRIINKYVPHAETSKISPTKCHKK